MIDAKNEAMQELNRLQDFMRECNVCQDEKSVCATHYPRYKYFKGLISGWDAALAEAEQVINETVDDIRSGLFDKNPPEITLEQVKEDMIKRLREDKT